VEAGATYHPSVVTTERLISRNPGAVAVRIPELDDVAPMDAAERGSPLAPLMPYAALMLAGCTLLVLHRGSFGDPAGLTAWVVCVAAGLLLVRSGLRPSRAPSSPTA